MRKRALADVWVIELKLPESTDQFVILPRLRLTSNTLNNSKHAPNKLTITTDDDKCNKVVLTSTGDVFVYVIFMKYSVVSQRNRFPYDKCSVVCCEIKIRMTNTSDTVIERTIN